ncbi:MAG: 4Fe-4S binding protein [Candidatus Helarchaeota archaeon]|nr:4Fe-4S binding protein [Candidatus Helarchaeota archaeon]
MSIDTVYESVRQKMRLGQLGTPKHKKVIEFLKLLWNEDEIKLLDNFDMAFQFLSARKLAKKAGIIDKEEKKKVKEILKNLAQRGTILSMGNQYAILTLVPGLFEVHDLIGKDTEERKIEIAKFWRWSFFNLLPQMYRAMDPQIFWPKLPYDAEEKLITIDESIDTKDQQILPGELVTEMIEKSDYYAKLYCQCRNTGKLVGEPCEIPEELGCFLTGINAKMLVERGIAVEMTKDEAIQYIKDCEKAGLVHMGMNSGGPETVTFICNCCPCHCVGLSGMAKVGVADYGRNNFEPRINPELCGLCDTCVRKCPMGAIIHQYPIGNNPADEKIIIMTQKCLGCGVCAANCPKNAINLVKVRTNGPPKTLKLGDKSVIELLRGSM